MIREFGFSDVVYYKTSDKTSTFLIVTEIGAGTIFHGANFENDAEGNQILGLAGTEYTGHILGIAGRWDFFRISEAARRGWGIMGSGRPYSSEEFKPYRDYLLHQALKFSRRQLP